MRELSKIHYEVNTVRLPLSPGQIKLVSEFGPSKSRFKKTSKSQSPLRAICGLKKGIYAIALEYKKLKLTLCAIALK